jgi:peptidoglycan-associated lipoprotein
MTRMWFTTLPSQEVLMSAMFERRSGTGSHTRIVSILALAVALAVSIGCKKTPPAASAEPANPAVTGSNAPEPVSDTEPMRPITTEDARPAASMAADDVNRRGILKSIYFDFDRYEIRPDQRQTLQDNARHLTGELAHFRVVVEGHCDERGTNEYNMALGDKRANATRQYLIQLGIPAARIRTVSYGEERPADQGHNETSWSMNRRAAFVVEEG